MQNRVLNWTPSLPDHRDFKYSMVEHGHAQAVYPSKVDLRPLMSPIMDQGDLGSCTGHAGAAAVEFLELQEIRMNLPVGKAPQEYVAEQFAPVSRLFIYYNERVIDGTTDQDAGANMRDACTVALKTGIPRESLWQYEDSLALVKPNAAAYAEAKNHKITAYYAIKTLQDMKRCLAHGFPFIFGISIYDSFMTDAVAASGIVPIPNANENLLGGHALTCVGYDDTKMMFIGRNSWGKGWGQSGYFEIPYGYLTNPDLASDMFTLRRVA